METEKEVATVMSELQWGHGSSLYSALIMIRTTLIKSRSALSQLVQLGAVRFLIQLLEDRHRHVSHTKTTDIVMSILANLCLEEDAREKVVCCEGLAVIARVTLSSEQESIQNRGVRALANLALDVVNCEKMFDLDVPAFVAKRLMETEDVECRSTYCRALQLFGQTGKDVKRLMEDTQAIQALAALLKLDNRRLALKSLRILSELSALRCCPSFTGQMLAANVLEELVTLADDEDSSPASYSLSIILRLCEQEIMRPALGSAGAISLMVKLMKGDRSYVNKVWTLNALCLCTKEAVNRNKVQEAGGLELFMAALSESQTGHLSEGQFFVLYDRIISSLVNFLYNDDCLDKLLELGLVKILMYHLKRSCTFASVNYDFRKEVDSAAVILETDEITHGGGGKLLKDGSKIETDSLVSNNVHLLGEDVPINTTSASCSISEFCNISVHQNSEIESIETENLIFPSGVSNLSPADQMGEEYQRVSKEKCNISDEEVDPTFTDNNIVISNDGMMVEHETEKSASPDSQEPSFHQPNTSRHTFSINSPTYQSETSWRLEDYTSGVTCKSFSQEQEANRMSPYYPSAYSVNTGLVQAPYSPLSAGASYYSPSHSSPSHSVLMSPLQSTIPSSPTSSPFQDSPTWLLSSPDNQNSPGTLLSIPSLSPLPLAYQNQFSPLSNDFPASPLFHERSPTPSSQTSLFSQDSFVPCLERHMDSFGSAAGASAHLDQLLGASTSGVPVAQNTVVFENVYSASEDDEDDDVCSDVDIEKPLPIVSEGTGLYSRKVDSCSTIEKNNNPEQLLTNKRCKAMETATSSKCSLAGIQGDPNDTGNSKRRRLNHKIVETGGGICHTESTVESISKVRRQSSGGFIPDVCSSDDEEIIKLSPSHIITNSFTVANLKIDEPDMHHQGTLNLKTGLVCTQKGTQRPSSVGFGRDSDTATLKSFKRMSSYPGKDKLNGKASSFRKNLSATLHGAPPLTAIFLASKYQTSPLISDSPYRSPFPESSQNSAASNEDLKPCAKTAKDDAGNNSRELLGNRSPLMQEKRPTVSKIADVADTSTVSSVCNSKKVVTQDIRFSKNTIDARVKKILRTTETNILILLARVSVKTKPINLADTTVTSCLLGYIASAPNPIRRSCRILHRICSNPHCFEKLILTQVPAMLVKSLVFEKDGTFPHDLLGMDWNRSLSDLLPSSQGSDCGSQASEFGKRMDFEFGGDAYSRMTTKKHSSVGNMFRNRPYLAVYGEMARDTVNTGDDIYESGSSRVEARVKIGIELLHTMGAVAMSRFGEGEIKHLLLRHSAQDKLACVMSMLNLRVGWCRITRHEFFTKYSIYEKTLPCLFNPEAPLVREAIVAAISLNVRIDNPPKLTQKIIKLSVCPDQATQKFTPACGAEYSSEQSNSGIKPKTKLSLKNSEKIEMFPIRSVSHDHTSNLHGNESTTLSSQNGQNINTATLCQHQNISPFHDVCFSVLGENDAIHKVSAHRKTLMGKSEVFGAMFSGSYTESTQSEIQVPDVNKYAFEFIIHYLHGCSSGCSVIESLSVESSNAELVAKEVFSAENQDLDKTMESDIQVSHYKEKGLEKNSVQDLLTLPDVNNASKGLPGGRVKSCTILAESHLKTKTSENMSPKLELTHSQDSLDSLTLEDRPESEKTSHASRKLNFMNNCSSENTVPRRRSLSQMDLSPQEFPDEKCLDELISRCENIIALADRFLLHGLVKYPVSVLAHVCLCPRTIEDIFHLACFYKLDSLAFDCIRETVMSQLPCNKAAAIFVELAADGYREQVDTALTWLLNYLHSD